MYICLISKKKFFFKYCLSSESQFANQEKCAINHKISTIASEEILFLERF